MLVMLCAIVLFPFVEITPDFIMHVIMCFYSNLLIHNSHEYMTFMNTCTHMHKHTHTHMYTRTHSERVTKTIFPQIAQQILQKPVVELRCSSRAWKVSLIGEGADDAGGVFDETMAQMCEVRDNVHPSLISEGINLSSQLMYTVVVCELHVHVSIRKWSRVL